MKSALTLWCGLSALLLAQAAHASDRHFGFNDESSVLKPGSAELQPWTTVRAGRADYYNQLEGRVAFEYGLEAQLQGALFWNFSSVAQDISVPGSIPPTRLTRLNDSEFDSFSLSLKYKLSDPVADALGSAVYLEGTFGPLVASAEGRIILDDQLGSWLLAGNLVADAIEHLEQRSTSEITLSAIASAGYFVTPTFVPGLEVRSDNGISSRLDRSVLYLGPNLSLMSAGFWTTLALEPQITAFKGATRSRHLDLDQNERMQARLLFGFRI